MKKYQIVSIHKRTGNKIYMTSKPVTNEKAQELMLRINKKATRGVKANYLFEVVQSY